MRKVNASNEEEEDTKEKRESGKRRGWGEGEAEKKGGGVRRIEDNRCCNIKVNSGWSHFRHWWMKT